MARDPLPPAGIPTPEPPGRRLRITPRDAAAAFLAVVALVFAFQNTHRVRITFLAWDINPPLWGTLLVTVVVGLAVGALVTRRRGTRGTKS